MKCAKRGCNREAETLVILNDPDGNDTWQACQRCAEEFAQHVARICGEQKATLHMAYARDGTVGTLDLPIRNIDAPDAE